VIVVDDGSVDNTKEVAQKLPGIEYVYQTNKGLSAARNTGISNSRGELLVFLDADDWLLPEGIKTNVAYLQQNKELAFVSGAHDKVFVDEGTVKEEVYEVASDHYMHLLQGNYIGMHATVMYRRWVFDEFSYDTSLKACEDYDLYLKISRKYPVMHHTTKIAAYRLHASNMSGNIPFMLATALEVLDRQNKSLRTATEEKAFKNGHLIWKDYYCGELYRKLLSKKATASKEAITALVRHKPALGLKYILKSILHA
jgi:glycosyltransferase involved in cell wall biosynthesis